MRDRNKQTDGQLSMLDGLLKAIDNGTVTAQDIIDMIHRLRDSYEEVKNREAEEKRKREEAEAKRRELLREEARQRHIEKVTSMDLPLTWENAFAAAVASPVPAFAPGACVAVSGVLAQDASSSADSRNFSSVCFPFSGSASSVFLRGAPLFCHIIAHLSEIAIGIPRFLTPFGRPRLRPGMRKPTGQKPGRSECARRRDGLPVPVRRRSVRQRNSVLKK